MAEIFPFRAYRYNPARVHPAEVLTQPYDKITPAMAEKYAAASPYNLISVEKGKVLPGDTPGNTVYTRAARALEDWIRAGVIARDATPSLYVYFQEYTVRERVTGASVKDSSRSGAWRIIPPASFFAMNRRFRGEGGPLGIIAAHANAHRQLFMLYSDAAARVDALLDAARAGRRKLRFGTNTK